jgi:hypothetical protein
MSTSVTFVQGWQPIAYAPRNGTKLDLWDGRARTTDAYWSSIQDCWCIDGMYGPTEPTPLPIHPAPTHFMVPPAGPEGA